MSVLAITYTDHPFTDYDGLSTTTRTYVAEIDGKITGMSLSCALSSNDTDMRQALKNTMIAKGLIWSSEI